MAGECIALVIENSITKCIDNKGICIRKIGKKGAVSAIIHSGIGIVTYNDGHVYTYNLQSGIAIRRVR